MGKQAIEGASRGQVFYVPADRVTIIGHDTSHKCGEHPLWDERALDAPEESLVRNIAAYGVKNAVKIRKNGDHEDGPYEGQGVLEVIDGRNRTKACREADARATKAGEVAPMLKVEFERGSDETQVGVMISLNEHVRSDGLLVKSAKVCRIIDMGRTEAEVADMFNVTMATIQRWRLLPELSKEVKTAITKGQISPTAAAKLHKLSHDDQALKLGEMLADGKATAAHASDKVTPNGKPRRVAILSKRMLNKLAKDDEWRSMLSGDAHAIIRVLCGDADAVDEVPGLKERLEG